MDGNGVINRWKEYIQDLYECTQHMEGIPEQLPIRETNGKEATTANNRRRPTSN
jgi:hypothetical protein